MTTRIANTPPMWGHEVDRSGADVSFESPRARVPAGEHGYVEAWTQRDDESWPNPYGYCSLYDTDVRLEIDGETAGTVETWLTPRRARTLAEQLTKAAELAELDLREQWALAKQQGVVHRDAEVESLFERVAIAVHYSNSDSAAITRAVLGVVSETTGLSLGELAGLRNEAVIS